jgi:hypothetical protein
MAASFSILARELKAEFSLVNPPLDIRLLEAGSSVNLCMREDLPLNIFFFFIFGPNSNLAALD